MTTSDGCKIHAWWMPHASRPRAVPTVVFFHGNAGNIGYRLPLLKELYHKGSMNILAVDYRGFVVARTQERKNKSQSTVGCFFVLFHLLLFFIIDPRSVVE